MLNCKGAMLEYCVHSGCDAQSWWFGWTNWRPVSCHRFFCTCSINVIVIVLLDESQLYITLYLLVFESLCIFNMVATVFNVLFLICNSSLKYHWAH